MYEKVEKAWLESFSELITNFKEFGAPFFKKNAEDRKADIMDKLSKLAKKIGVVDADMKKYDTPDSGVGKPCAAVENKDAPGTTSRPQCTGTAEAPLCCGAAVPNFVKEEVAPWTLEQKGRIEICLPTVGNKWERKYFVNPNVKYTHYWYKCIEGA